MSEEEVVGMGWLIFPLVMVVVGLLVRRNRRRGSGEIGQTRDMPPFPLDRTDLGPPPG